MFGALRNKYKIVLIVAKCIVNTEAIKKIFLELIVLIVAKCIVN